MAEARANVVVKRFGKPDETRTFEKGLLRENVA
jgi:hypothetical protein